MKAVLIGEFIRVSQLAVPWKNVTYIYQDLDDIKISKVPQPQAKDGEVLVQIVAAGVNFVDILYVSFIPTWVQLCGLASIVILHKLFWSYCSSVPQVAFIIPKLNGIFLLLLVWKSFRNIVHQLDNIFLFLSRLEANTKTIGP